MSTFANRDATVLLVIDVQNGVIGWAFERDRVVANVKSLVEGARATSIPIVWVQHNESEMPIGSEYWQIVPELVPAEGEPRVDKQFRSSFEATTLDEVLADLDAARLIICGAETNFCIRHTLHSALERGYDVTLVADAHTAVDSDEVPAVAIIEEQNRSCADYQLPGRRCDLTTTAEAFA